MIQLLLHFIFVKKYSIPLGFISLLLRDLQALCRSNVVIVFSGVYYERVEFYCALGGSVS